MAKNNRKRRSVRTNQRLPLESYIANPRGTATTGGRRLLEDIARRQRARLEALYSNPRPASVRPSRRALLKRATRPLRSTQAYDPGQTISRLAGTIAAPIGSIRPERVPICVRRKQRTEVIHAIGAAGKGGQKSPVWTKQSKVRCK